MQSLLVIVVKDNVFTHHEAVRNETTLSLVSKLAVAKAITVSELYARQDIKRITGPDIFQELVLMSVTETASLYDKKKVKLIRAETGKVDIANGEIPASLDYLKLPGSYNVLQGSIYQKITVNKEFRRWYSWLAGHKPFHKVNAPAELD